MCNILRIVPSALSSLLMIFFLLIVASSPSLSVASETLRPFLLPLAGTQGPRPHNVLLAESYLSVENVPPVTDSSLHRVTVTSLRLSEGDDCTQRTEPMVLGAVAGLQASEISAHLSSPLSPLLVPRLEAWTLLPKKKTADSKACSVCMPARTRVCVCECEWERERIFVA